MTRSFDPVLSAALRNELEHLADREATRPARPLSTRAAPARDPPSRCHMHPHARAR